MPFSFLPRMIYPHLTDVRAEDLTARGVSFLMLDFDNTIVPYTTSEPTPEMAAWLGAMQASGIGLCVVSNSRKPRVVTFCEKYGLDCITHAKSPFRAASARVWRVFRWNRPAARSWAIRSTRTYWAQTARGCSRS